MEDTKQRILEKSLELFSTKGYDAVSVNSMRWLAYMTRIRIGTFSTIGTPFFFRLSNAKMMLRLIFIIGCV